MEYNVSVIEIEDYVKKIFDLQKNLSDKSYKVAQLEFELAMEKQLMTAFKKTYLESVISYIE